LGAEQAVRRTLKIPRTGANQLNLTTGQSPHPTEDIGGLGRAGSRPSEALPPQARASAENFPAGWEGGNEKRRPKISKKRGGQRKKDRKIAKKVKK